MIKHSAVSGQRSVGGPVPRSLPRRQGYGGRVGEGGWTADYVGLPYADKGRDRDGVDCWGLVRLVYAELMGIELPSHADGYVSAAELADVTRAIRGNMRPWSPVARPHALDVVLLRIAGSEAHVGLIVGGGFMLHVHAGIDTALERIDTALWRRRIVGTYRHDSMVDGVGVVDAA